ncbi:hypothetical protein GCM10023324_08650 [Streptomyces youssoufiensis]
MRPVTPFIAIRTVRRRPAAPAPGWDRGAGRGADWVAAWGWGAGWGWVAGRGWVSGWGWAAVIRPPSGCATGGGHGADGRATAGASRPRHLRQQALSPAR